jgi:phosphoesterase RecJ-like protein
VTTPYHRAAVYLRHAESVVVCGHVNPDGDALASVLGLTIGLREAGIPAVPTLADARPAPSGYDFLPGFDLFVPAADLNTPDTFVALDTPTPDRLGDARRLAEASENLIVMDHHPDNQEFGTVNVVEARIAATGLLVMRLIERLDLALSPEVATCLYVALMTDTGRFQFANTTPDALRDAAALVEAGAHPAELAQSVYHSRRREVLELEARVLARIEVANAGRVAYTYVTRDDYDATGARPDETENLVDVVRALAGIDVAMLLRVRDREVRGNLRSKTAFDVGEVARRLGGGGHAAASGFTVEGTLDDVVSKVLAELPGHGGA